jgi:hypothetical protein
MVICTKEIMRYVNGLPVVFLKDLIIKAFSKAESKLIAFI